jgi:putative membrane protein
MDRRVVLAGLAAFAAAPALAQQSGGGATAAGGATSAMPAGQAGAARLGQAEMQHMQQTLQLGSVALETSRLAQQKARSEDLKQFAGFEVEEQTTIAEILRGMMDPTATAATAPAQGNAAAGAAPQMDSKGREMIQKLSQAQGDSFDREYLMGQIEGHRDLLEVQERYLKSSSQNRDHANVVKLARGRIMEHIALLEDMQKTVK